mmetsp:Transcript_11933/g.25752  ORF Transcript_11933/g.25752 Transcript_11933/m.25752 type:complete len:95 (+) Transcript_11933:50-334(+)|eukprot:CAMPEP_0204366736 /NCGR_PEP_ID=MMETSP0469-20131031/42895_1 /ASSEMBLY_ACC=CAM_ASM_000384 /TAXON_ID=2969 /ORGANISM="Oxyrrhis marina" /LENGTH=94 /DNA_ID=CAMNT_0051355991 /DNA_START=27 /DNA_END=311 /DNA_ORIENTATION=+
MATPMMVDECYAGLAGGKSSPAVERSCRKLRGRHVATPYGKGQISTVTEYDGASLCKVSLSSRGELTFPRQQVLRWLGAEDALEVAFDDMALAA